MEKLTAITLAALAAVLTSTCLIAPPLYPVEQLELAAYNTYTTGDIVPSVEELEAYLGRTATLHSLGVIGETELWAAERSPNTQDIRYTQLLTRRVARAKLDGEARLGVDRNNGQVYIWTDGEAPDWLGGALPHFVISPEVFPTPLSALDYIKEHFWWGATAESSPELSLTDDVLYPFYYSEPVFLAEDRSSAPNLSVTEHEVDSYLIHIFEHVQFYEDDGTPGDGHIATTGRYRVYKNGFIVDELLQSRWIANP